MPNQSLLGLDRTWEPFFSAHRAFRDIQRDAIPRVLARHNVMLCAPTGSGKTEAALVPLVERALDFRGTLTILYICPTRALINDLAARVATPFHRLGLHLGVQHGDNQSASGSRVPEMVLTTPESLEGALSRTDHPLHPRLRSVRAVVIDEIHSLYGNPRGAQLRILLERLAHHCERSFQRIAMSATMANPDVAGQWFQGSGAPFTVLAGYPGRDFKLVLEAIRAETASDYLSGKGIRNCVRGVVPSCPKLLLFANTRRECDWLFQHLEGQVGIPVHLHYSSLPRERREETERRFRAEPRALCVATSTLELGIDIGNIDAVLMFGAPKTAESFAQRLGRGNRRSGTSVVRGLCRSFSESGVERPLLTDVLLFVALATAMDRGLLETVHAPLHYGVLAQQLAAMAIRYGQVGASAMARPLAALGFPETIGDVLSEILAGMVEQDLLVRNPVGPGFVAADAIEDLRRGASLWSNIPGASVATVLDAQGPVAEVPRDFVPRLEPGSQIRVAGRVRRVTRVDGNSISTTQVSGPVSGNVETPGYRSQLTFGSAVLAGCAREALRGRGLASLPISYDDATRASLKAERARFAGAADEETMIEFVGEEIVLYTFLGGLLNRIYLDLLKMQVGASGSSDSLAIRVKNTDIFALKNPDSSYDAVVLVIQNQVQIYASMLSLSPHTKYLSKALLLSDVMEAIRPREASARLTAFLRSSFRQLEAPVHPL